MTRNDAIPIKPRDLFLAKLRRQPAPRLATGSATSVITRLTVIRKGTPETIRRDVQEKLAAGIDILGPECAVPPDAPWANLKTLAEEGKRLSATVLVRGVGS